MVCELAGISTVVPTAAIFPSRITMVPFSMSAPETVTMRALRIANAPRGGMTPCCVVGLPICCANADAADRKTTIKALIISASPPQYHLHGSGGAAPASVATVLVRVVCSAPPVQAPHALWQARAGAPGLVGGRNKLR